MGDGVVSDNATIVSEVDGAEEDGVVGVVSVGSVSVSSAEDVACAVSLSQCQKPQE